MSSEILDKKVRTEQLTDHFSDSSSQDFGNYIILPQYNYSLSSYRCNNDIENDTKSFNTSKIDETKKKSKTLKHYRLVIQIK